MAYDHTQRAPLHWILWFACVPCIVGAFAVREHGWPSWVLVGCAFLVALAALSFTWLRVRDEGDALGVRFGPLPLFRRRVLYGEVAAVRAGRSRWIDGWGVHWMPGRGWIWNLWGFDCVELDLVRGRLRIGSDDAPGLVAFLRARIAAGSPPA